MAVVKNPSLYRLQSLRGDTVIHLNEVILRESVLRYSVCRDAADKNDVKS